MVQVSVVIACYNVENYITGALASLRAQTFRDFEILIIDDGSTDTTLARVAEVDDPRIRVIKQANRGLNGARNTGIIEAAGAYIGFLDADDIWEPTKLAEHVQHLDSNPDLGMSYSASLMIDEAGRALGLVQQPKLRDIRPEDIYCRNPIGNGSAAILRRETFGDIEFFHESEPDRPWYFDETFRQSTDIECWVRIALDTDWRIEGLAAPLTRYRINADGLSSDIQRQYENWEKIIHRTYRDHPEFAAKFSDRARGYQLRYLARRAVSSRNGRDAFALMRQAIKIWPRMVLEEPAKTCTTALAATILHLCGQSNYETIEKFILKIQGKINTHTYCASKVRSYEDHTFG